MKPGIYNYVADVTTHANPCGAATTWVVSANTRHVIRFGFLVDHFFFLSFFVYSWVRAAPSHVNRFLMIYTSYDVIPRKDVPFMGLFVAIPHLGDQICQKPQFFKRNVQKILNSAYYQNCCIDSNQILHNTKDLQALIVGGPNTAQQIQDGGRPPF